MAFYQLKRTQVIPSDISEVWNFISTPRNLSKITPDYMGFDITSAELPEKMYEGMIISYKVSPFLGLKTDWVTEITHLREKKFFVDEQRIGPYNIWHHEHHIEPVEDGVKMKDVVTYQPPLGPLGVLANKLFIKNKLQEIFDYREQVVDQYFK
ncbi:SRPBCC family protein [Aliifodinibius salicampi]|uniref:SRPBCC family protein n=1 Tax=Fodinibius salicampi TaxID=1920655 RepID=A0ABT3PVG1_9BACT|nr:SRPBCC family protein [Fodinibius salicampi]MCW9711796.1 SRPBCC family protein [Fodinibius salicampi]